MNRFYATLALALLVVVIAVYATISGHSNLLPISIIAMGWIAFMGAIAATSRRHMQDHKRSGTGPGISVVIGMSLIAALLTFMVAAHIRSLVG